MSGQKRPSTGLGVQSPCIRAIFYSCFVLFNSRVPWKRVPHIIQQQPTRFDSKVLSSRYRSTRVEYKQGMQASPTKGFQGGDDAGTETADTHSRARIPCTRPHTQTYVHAHLCTDTHANTHVRVR